MDAKVILEQFHDYLAPQLDTYEQAIYLYVLRHGRLQDGFTDHQKDVERIRSRSMSSVSTKYWLQLRGVHTVYSLFT